MVLFIAKLTWATTKYVPDIKVMFSETNCEKTKTWICIILVMITCSITSLPNCLALFLVFSIDAYFQTFPLPGRPESHSCRSSNESQKSFFSMRIKFEIQCDTSTLSLGTKR